MSFPYHAPIAPLARELRTANPETSILNALEALRENGGWLPVVRLDRGFLGWVGEAEAQRALREGMDLTGQVKVLVNPPKAVLWRDATLSEAMRILEDSESPILAVVDGEGRFLGGIAPSDLLPKYYSPERPPMVGGLATPFGVYLTSGGVTAGPNGWALFLTGMAMVSLLLVAGTVSNELAEAIFRLTARDSLALGIGGVASFLFFFTLMRLVPLSGTHGAEHQVVHAIERGEPLEPSIVRRMPRVHPRCGTNFGVGVILFLGIGTAPWIPSEELRLLLAAVVTLTLWRRIGSFVQQNFTTKPPTDRQLEAGIRSGKELLERYAKEGHPLTNPWERIWRSGLLQVMSGGWAAAGLAYLLGQLIGYPIVQ